ncbi:ChrR family anti-sigma-E factor [Paraferrimonas haliotis]|uniref:Transcriptional regulator n=1 Tax=Paraferrimonas haliotis TaxID=2013866 RepID=A0AA37WXP7_9GAMM|nr:ChrR family anti-sigma-E factor [Paraferrimonas haliotis]GLS84617.1 transcriptional regulator [Paraferrimonas haliotis]
MTSVKLHPSEDTLKRFALAELDPSESIIISAHVELCSECQSQLQAIESAHAQEMASSDTDELTFELDDEFSSMMSHIMESPADYAVAQPIKRTLKLGDKEYNVPRALVGHVEQVGPWSRLPGKLQRAAVQTGGESKMNFIYMDEDSALPEHTHTGVEITLVLDGEFEDENGVYKAGDFVIQSGEHTHTPRTKPGQDCLCLTLLQSPLHFTSGFASLLNPFSQLFFR